MEDAHSDRLCNRIDGLEEELEASKEKAAMTRRAMKIVLSSATLEQVIKKEIQLRIEEWGNG